MRLTFIISDYHEQNIRALPWKYVYELASNLAQKGCKVQVITDGSEIQNETKGFIVSTVSKTRQPPTFSLVMNPRQVDSAIEEFSPNLVCVFGDPLTGYFVRRLRNRTPVIVNVSKGVYTLRKLQLSPYLDFINSAVAKSLIRLLNQRKIVAITVPTSTIKRSLERCGVSNTKIVVLPMAFDKTSYERKSASSDRSEIRQELGLGNEEFIVTYLGPPYSRRGVGDLVRAIGVLKEKFPVRLLLLLRQKARSESLEIDSLRRLASKLQVTDRTTFIVSVLPRGNLVRYLESSDIVALPFRYVDEEPPLGFLEAMALGKPVVATNIDSLPEVVGNNRGILVRPGNVSDLSKTIYYLFRHPDVANSMAAEGIKYTQTLKNWDELADCFLHLAEKLLDRP